MTIADDPYRKTRIYSQYSHMFQYAKLYGHANVPHGYSSSVMCVLSHMIYFLGPCVTYLPRVSIAIKELCVIFAHRRWSVTMCDISYRRRFNNLPRL
jgi:hypothetical protein